MPISNVLLIVQILTPLNEIIHLSIEVLIIKLHKALIIKRVLIELLQSILVDPLCDLRLLLYQLRILSVFIELSQPFEFFDPLFLSSLLFSLRLIEVELDRLVARAQLDRVKRRQNLI